MSATVQWSPWASLERPPQTELARPFAQHNQDGRIEVFARGGGAIFSIWQIGPNVGWHDGWGSGGRPSSAVGLKAHAVGRNADGRLEIFAVGDDNALWQQWQTALNNGWSGWKSLGTPASDAALGEQFAVGRNQDGRQEIFVVAADGNVWQIWQTAPNGGWSNWKQLGRPAPGIRHPDRISVESNKDFRQELFLLGGDDALWHIHQVAPNVGWGSWASLGKPRDSRSQRDLTEPVARKNADGHLEVFSPGNGAFCNRWQEAPNSDTWRHEGWNEKPKPQPDVGIVWLDAALNTTGPLAGHIEAFALGDDGALWHAWQIDVKPNWSPWHSLGAPPAKIRAADRLTTGTNRDGRLEVFVIGGDGALWHIWQMG